MIYGFITRFGRKYSLSIFAGVSSLVVTVVGLWIAARTSAETATVVERLVSGYLFAAGAMVTAYAGSNAWVEVSHAKAGTASAKAPPSLASAAPVAPRVSGTVPSAEGE